jgi:hypothetical protein
LWLSVLTGAILVPFAIRGSARHIGPTKFCIQLDVQAYGPAVATITSSVFDTIVFVSISYRIITGYNYGCGVRALARAFSRGEGLPTIAKALLQSGQQYYLYVFVETF